MTNPLDPVLREARPSERILGQQVVGVQVSPARPVAWVEVDSKTLLVGNAILLTGGQRVVERTEETPVVRVLILVRIPPYAGCGQQPIQNVVKICLIV